MATTATIHSHAPQGFVRKYIFSTDHKTIGNGVMEMRFNFGSGYRIYYGEEGGSVILLLIGYVGWGFEVLWG